MLLQKLINNIEKYKDNIAVVAKEEAISYSELGTKSRTIAQNMLRVGLGKGKTVAVYSDRSADTIVGIVAAMFSGAAYTIVELDGNVDESISRLHAIEPDAVISDAQYCEIINDSGFSQYSYQELLNTDTSKEIDESLLGQSENSDTAYVLYTSGSTGKPKGVCVSHGNVAHYTKSICETTNAQNEMRYAHLSTLAADLGNTSLFLSLYTGGCLHLIGSEDRKDSRVLIEYFRKNKIDFIKITPSHWKAIFSAFSVSGESFPKLSHLIFGGEALRQEVVDAAIEADVAENIFNHYGPTEATVGVTAIGLKVKGNITSIERDLIPIGYPFGDTTLMVKTDDGYSMGPGKGELLIGGPSVAIGYLGLAEQTAEKFITIDAPNGEELRCYRTGDHVEIGEDGIVHFIGRIDRQVKINGYRVELESIENTIRSLASVKDASVVYLSFGKKSQLLSAVVKQDDDVTQEIIKEELKKLVPGYMVPNHIYMQENLPRNANGKTNVKEIESILKRAYEEDMESFGSNDSENIDNVYEGEKKEIYDLIAPVYKKYISSSAPGLEDNFYDLGGNSLDAVQLIAELQYKNISVSANDFIESPTLGGLVESVYNNNQNEQHGSTTVVKERDRIEFFSAAQDLFIKEEHANPDVYNQAVFFEIKQEVNKELLEKAFDIIVEQHELLRTAFISDDSGNYAKTVAPIKCLSYSSIEGLEKGEGLEDEIYKVSQELQNSLSLNDGNIFKAHLFEKSESQSYLLFVGHHLCVDIISWRIILSELTRAYCDMLEGREIPNRSNRYNFWDWVDHFEGKKEISENRTQVPALSENTTPSVLNSKIEHTEGETETFWFGYTQEQSAILENIAAKDGIPVHLIFLSVCAHELGKIESLEQVTIDVESHGRISLDKNIDTSRVVGWHTSTFPLNIDVNHHVLEKTMGNTKASYDGVENLGIADAWSVHQLDVEDIATSAICYNFLGDIDFPHDDRIEMKASPMKVGKTRGAANKRFHNIKVSVQKINRQYIVDISYPSNLKKLDQIPVLRLIHSYRDSMNRLVGNTSQFMEPILEDGSATGAIHYCPDKLIIESEQQKTREYNSVLLTGGTGYIGVYCLKGLLETTDVEVTCLVRASKDKSGVERLQDNWNWYFDSQEWDKYCDRIHVLDSDLTKAEFGLPSSKYEELVNSVDAIYHFAADTRLIGSEKEFLENNLEPLGRILEFSTDRKIKDLHYMSTLAICGVSRGNKPATFSEDSLDIGQDFQNGYEKTKFMAEQLVNKYLFEGYPVFTYRTGNVSGDSTTGRFQKNASANRLVQFLNACSKLGMLPTNIDEQLNLSPIDVVAKSVVGLSLDANQERGVYHVDTPHYFSIREIFRELELRDFKFNQSRSKNFGELFQTFDGTSDADLALGRFWSLRRPRNVNYDHSKTLRKMKKLGYEFEKPTAEWVSKFVDNLIEVGAVKKANANLLHLDQFTRNRIFSLPHNPVRSLRRDGMPDSLTA